MKRSVIELVAMHVGLCLFLLACDADGSDGDESDGDEGDACVIGTLGCPCLSNDRCSGKLICTEENICVRVDAGIDADTPIDTDANLNATIEGVDQFDGNAATEPRPAIDAAMDASSIVYPDSSTETDSANDIDTGANPGTDTAVDADAGGGTSGQSNGILSFTYQPKEELPPMLVFAIWMENSSGEYLRSISIGDFIGRRGGGNRGNPDIDSVSDADRPSSLPIWAYRRNVIDTTFGYESLYPPPASSAAYPDDIDAVTTATPAGGTTQVTTFELTDLPYGRYNFFMEANHSFDQNSSHDYSWYRGQPSVLWRVSLDIGDAPQSASVLDYVGYGSPDGSDGNVRPADSTITTAADLITDIGGYRFKVEYTP